MEGDTASLQRKPKPSTVIDLTKLPDDDRWTSVKEAIQSSVYDPETRSKIFSLAVNFIDLTQDDPLVEEKCKQERDRLLRVAATVPQQVRAYSILFEAVGMKAKDGTWKEWFGVDDKGKKNDEQARYVNNIKAISVRWGSEVADHYGWNHGSQKRTKALAQIARRVDNWECARQLLTIINHDNKEFMKENGDDFLRTSDLESFCAKILNSPSALDERLRRWWVLKPEWDADATVGFDDYGMLVRTQVAVPEGLQPPQKHFSLHEVQGKKEYIVKELTMDSDPAANTEHRNDGWTALNDRSETTRSSPLSENPDDRMEQHHSPSLCTPPPDAEILAVNNSVVPSGSAGSEEAKDVRRSARQAAQTSNGPSTDVPNNNNLRARPKSSGKRSRQSVSNASRPAKNRRTKQKSQGLVRANVYKEAIMEQDREHLLDTFADTLHRVLEDNEENKDLKASLYSILENTFTEPGEKDSREEDTKDHIREIILGIGSQDRTDCTHQVMSDKEASRLFENPDAIINNPVFIVGQQPVANHGMEDYFFATPRRSDCRVPVQSYARSIYEDSFEDQLWTTVQGRLNGNQNHNDRPICLLDLPNPFQETTVPWFLRGPQCRLLHELRGFVLDETNNDEGQVNGQIIMRQYDSGPWKVITEWAMMSEGGYHTTPHIDTHGYSTWIQAQEGSFVLGWLARDYWLQMWLADPEKVAGEWQFRQVDPGEVVFIPHGTPHIVMREKDTKTMAHGGHILRYCDVLRWLRHVIKFGFIDEATNEEQDPDEVQQLVTRVCFLVQAKPAMDLGNPGRFEKLLALASQKHWFGKAINMEDEDEEGREFSDSEEEEVADE